MCSSDLVHLDATVAFERFTQHVSVLGERLGIALGPALVQQLRRPFDVREEEGDGAAREFGSHGQMMRERDARDKLLPHRRRCGRGRLLPVAGQDPRAELEQALALYERKGNLVMAKRTRSRLAEITASR